MTTQSDSTGGFVVSWVRALAVACFFVAAGIGSCSIRADDGTLSIEWERTFGTPLSDEAFSSTIDSFGNIFVAGQTQGSFDNPDAEHTGNSDAFVAKHDANGQLIWARTIGGGANDAAWSVATDDSGGVYIAGISQTGLGGPLAYGTFPFLARYDAAGTLEWAKQVIANGVNGPYFAASVTTGSPDNVFVSSSASIAKYDKLGNHEWTHNTHTNVQQIVSDDGDNLFVAGKTLTGDGFLSKFDSLGNELWIRQFETTENDFVFGLATDSQGSVYLSGATSGNLAAENAGGLDIFVSRWSGDGNHEWTRQFGTPLDDWAKVTTSDRGVLITGLTEIDFGDYEPPWNLIAAELNFEGGLIWAKDFVGQGDVLTVANVNARLPTIFVAGTFNIPNHTPGSKNYSDLYVAKLRLIPEPHPLILLTFVVILSPASRVRIRRHLPCSNLQTGTSGGHNASIIAGAAA